MAEPALPTHSTGRANYPKRIKEEYLVRFNLRQRIEHIVLLIVFTALAVTGLAEKYYTAGWADWLIMNLGGIAMTRLIHRGFGILFSLAMFYHFIYLFFNTLLRHGKLTMLISVKDFRDILDSLRYSFGFSDKPLSYGRFDYRQKFEYWGILFGSLIMIVSGFVLMYPIWTTSFLPGQFVAASRVAHGNEAMLAVLTIVIWHLYDVIFKPTIFPADVTIFSGRISKKRMMEEHALEYAELTANNSNPIPENPPAVENAALPSK
jgi:formate dehydrogenase subunit gamma